MQVVILAGGRSNRFGEDGEDKALFRLDGERLVDRLYKISSAAGFKTSVQGRVPEATDPWPGFADPLAFQGPAAALINALQRIAEPLLLIAVDMPAINSAALHWLAAQPTATDGCVPLVDQQLQPCFAKYTPHFILHLQDECAHGKASLQRAIARADFTTPQLPAELRGALSNCNTRSEAEALRMKLEQ